VSDRIRVLLVDDHRMFGEALTRLLELDHDVDMLGALQRAEDALEFCREHKPDVVLMDLDLPGKDGIEATRLLKDISPETKVVIITALQQPEVVARAIEAGACGYVLKTRAPDELVSVIRRAASGEIVMSPADILSVLSNIQRARFARSEVSTAINQLTSREIEILHVLATGKSTAGEVARELFISPLTVQSHIKSILSKLGVHSKLEAVTFALRHGVIQIPQSA
jgi:two-component system, NarL family, response regulator LiaR